jgi:hypothetical protein
MPFTRRHRHAVCRWLVGVLLAVQWLVASHACAAGTLHAAQLAGQGAGGAVHGPAMPDCHQAMLAGAQAQLETAQDGAPHATPYAAAPAHASGASQDDAALCKAHCTAGQQLPADAPAAHAAPPLCGWCIVQLPPPLAAAPATAAALAPAQGGAPPPGWPPLFIAHGVLRN